MKLALTTSLLLLTAALALAVPQQFNYQGYLTAPDGTPLDTTVAITFRIYDLASGGNVLWAELSPAVSVTGGMFHVLLGSISPLGDLFNENRWLEIQVGSDVAMTPRQQIVSVAHAYRTGTVDGAAGGAIAGNVSINGKVNIGPGNVNSGVNAFVAANFSSATGDYSSISGGSSNWATAFMSSVAGGSANHADNNYAAVGGGGNNRATGVAATLAGGRYNRARGDYTFVGGGGGPVGADSNSAMGHFSIVGGGSGNIASLDYSSIMGGQANRAGERAIVGGGAYNLATGNLSTVAGGHHNRARGNYSFVGGGGGEDIADSNAAYGYRSAVVGGSRNYASETLSAIGGGYSNRVGGFCSAVSGGSNNHATGYAAAIVGGAYNRARGAYAFVGGGGGVSADSNVANGNYSCVPGGTRNHVFAHWSAVGGGHTNTISSTGTYSVIAGGMNNTINDNWSSILGGSYNEINGSRSIALGSYITIGGRASVGLGRNITCAADSAFVWSDGTGPVLSIGSSKTFSVKATNGTRFWTNSSLTSGVTIGAGGNAWVQVSDSTRKRNIRGLDTEDILNRFASLPLKRWEYDSEEPGVEHIGPMAQDFWNAFHLGNEPLGISTIDADGVMMAAIQELSRKIDEIAELKTRILRLEALLSERDSAAERGTSR